MRAQESYKQSNVGAATYGPIIIEGGRYQLAAHATWGGGNLALQQLLPDGATFVAISGTPEGNGGTPAASITADGVLYFDLPPGTYQAVVTTATVVYFALTRVPLE